MSDTQAREALSRMNMREIAILPSYEGFASDLRFLAAADPKVQELARLERREELCKAYGLDASTQAKPFAFASGIAIIPIAGTLINRFNSSYSSITGYNFIRQQVMAAGMDADVKGIVYDVNSYGGEAAGCFECSADMKIAANGKPTLAVIDSNCYSAAFALACSADRIVCTPSGGVGSVGVVAMHVDFSKLLDTEGIKVTFITAGDHKVDGNPYEALSKEVKADMQISINKSYDAFVGLVAAGRKMDAKKVRGTEARIYRADDGLSIGFIDAIESPNLAVRSFFGELSGSNGVSLNKEPIMANEEKSPGAAEQAATIATAVATAVAAAQKAERTRQSGIKTCEEAKGREALADHLALNTEMSVDEAKGILAASPKTPEAKPGDKTNALAAAMDATGGGANVGSDAAAGAEDVNPKEFKTDAEASGFLLNSFALASNQPDLKVVAGGKK